MKVVDFYGLGRATQDKLLGSLSGDFDPKPILWRHGPRLTAPLWLATSATATMALALLAAVGFGKLDSALAIHPLGALLIYMFLVGLVAFGVSRAYALRIALKDLPFTPGVYVFPANVIDARDKLLRVWSLGELSDVSPTRSGEVRLRFGQTRFTFRVPDRDPMHAVETVQQARETRSYELDESERSMLDPLLPPVVLSPLAPTEQLTTSMPKWVRYGWLGAAGLGIVIGAGLFFLRNSMSDAQMFASARARDDIAAYKSYLEQGQSNRDSVSREHLPRAELRVAIAKGTVEAIEEVMRAYPDAQILQEMDTARRGALVVAFVEARNKNNLSSLFAFSERYPKHGHDKELNAAKHAVYVRALNRHKRQMPEDGEATVELVERLLASAEKIGPQRSGKNVHGPTVQVRMRHIPSRDLDRADELVKVNPMFRGPPSLPTQYVDAKHLAPHETRAAKAMSEALARGFDAEVITFAPGPPLDGAAKIPKVKQPTLVLSYRIEPSGTAYASKKPRGIFVGLVFFFDVQLHLPGDDKPSRSEHTLARSIPLELVRKGGDDLEAAVYNAILEAAFREVQKRYLAQWFSKP
jgi:hypothetical protein